MQYVQEDPDVKVSFLRTMIIDKYTYNVSRRRACDAKRKTLFLQYEEWNDVMPQLLNAIHRSNPGAKVEWLYDKRGYLEGHAQFEKLFWSCIPFISAFKYYRHIVSIDKTFFFIGKHKYKILIACSMNGANHICSSSFCYCWWANH